MVRLDERGSPGPAAPGSRPWRPRGVASLLLGLLVLLWALPHAAVADPLPLSRPHAALDTASECNRCHIAFTGVPDAKCTACHRDIDQRIQRGSGYHGRMAGNVTCNTCHREHLGRDHEIVPLDRRTFDHDQTGWPLTGGHVGPPCRECHTAKRPGSQRDSYLGAETACKACHGEYHGKAHGKVDLSDCDDCHNTVDWKRLNGNLKFDHERDTRFPRTGKHKDVRCDGCHADRKAFGPIPVAGCATCHADPHPKGVFGQRICEECHVTAGFDRTQVFEHVTTGFALRGKHQQNKCLDCHKWERWKPKSSECATCHKDTHRGQFGGTPCSRCHQETGFDDVGRFNHTTMSRFPLQGRHKKVDCARCHPDGRYKPIDPRCETCHVEQNPHGETFADRPCANCHSPESWRQTRFDHGVTGFPLTGRHEPQPCHRCHPNGTETQDDTVADCAFCHRDVHRGQFEGSACDRCHRSFDVWPIPLFDHTVSRFQLEGRHQDVACGGCHKGGHFRPIDTACGNCHLNFHEGQFSKPCETCHAPTGWRPARFDHDTQSEYPLFGLHRSLDCMQCHVANDYKGLPFECEGCHLDVHAGDKGPACALCHTTNDWSTNSGQNHDFGAYRLGGAHDRLACEVCHGPDRSRELAGTGPQCAQCHRDPHFGSFGPLCLDCHTQTAFLPSTFLHVRTGFRLSGAHRFVACRECHPGRVFGGLPSTCDFCHTDTFRAARQPDHVQCCPGGLTACEGCHTTRSFVPARPGTTCGNPEVPACAPR
jgi:hypothetical protein